MDEVCETFDVPYIHIGTDEVKFTNPRFVPEMVDYVRSKGKKVISWNPGWKYKEGEIDMTQLWSFRGRLSRVFLPLTAVFTISIISICLLISLLYITVAFIIRSMEMNR